MIEDLDAQEVACFLQPAGDLHVFATGGRVAGGVIVHEDNRRCRLPHCLIEDLPWMDDAFVL